MPRSAAEGDKPALNAKKNTLWSARQRAGEKVLVIGFIVGLLSSQAYATVAASGAYFCGSLLVEDPLAKLNSTTVEVTRIAEQYQPKPGPVQELELAKEVGGKILESIRNGAITLKQLLVLISAELGVIKSEVQGRAAKVDEFISSLPSEIGKHVLEPKGSGWEAFYWNTEPESAGKIAQQQWQLAEKWVALISKEIDLPGLLQRQGLVGPRRTLSAATQKSLQGFALGGVDLAIRTNVLLYAQTGHDSEKPTSLQSFFAHALPRYKGLSVDHVLTSKNDELVKFGVNLPLFAELVAEVIRNANHAGARRAWIETQKLYGGRPEVSFEKRQDGVHNHY